MGRYVWRKSSLSQNVIVTNPTFTGYTATEGLVISNASFDIAKLDTLAKVKKFFADFVRTTSSSFYDVEFDSNATLQFIFSYTTYEYPTTGFDVSTATLTHSGGTFESTFRSTSFDFKYTGTKVIEGGTKDTPICFVCSNKADQYPSNGEYNGYWYELIGTIESTNALSLSTLSADTMRDIAIEEVQQEVINVD